uniref:BZIP domain-containing protein n=1 Tax=Percolomonas cosmopolitus TaxID=63605 RepID=A0A7S1KQL5_9EUKA|mmetsp:Transcript_5338/g.19953  ORF Transcript_5338/g.19953 Transcript_5338/m.19953 type:complete len:493 (+) Transcript_5338:144-1622(+)|eukprot:CAMPEP_0117447104 /NCGR_PEP_ID=MMETSP0759-20121206/6693_1 /TAXON_ID=63605 /ORGANISM="Percolomonas cosmopolitus, Strain WS" /LENGTH=492 /DNA_ID=CAMNT_0005239409 /DNA_START=163 /DNA_END=1641 /DNA_ORIENTATION=+
MLPRVSSASSFDIDSLLISSATNPSNVDNLIDDDACSANEFINSFVFDEDSLGSEVVVPPLSHDAANEKQQQNTASAAAVFQQWLNSVALPAAANTNTATCSQSSQSKKEQEVESICSASSSGASSEDDEDDEEQQKRGNKKRSAMSDGDKKSCASGSKSPESKSKKRKRGTTAAGPEDKAKKRREANRLSAAASRERKKRYVKDLEKRVKSMESEHETLRQTMTVTQMENARLRSLVERLARATSKGALALQQEEESESPSVLDALHEEEPSLKRRKICTEISVPVHHHTLSVDSSSTPTTATMEHDLMCGFNDDIQKADLPEDNPFNVSFWDKVPTGKAMLFVMIFCIALFVGLGGQSSTDLFYGGNRGMQQQNMPRGYVGRRILSQCLGDQHQRISELTAFPGVEHPTREMISNRISSVLSQVQKLVEALNGGGSSRRSARCVGQDVDLQPFDEMNEGIDRNTVTTTTTSRRAPRRRLQHHGDIERAEL